MHTQTQSITRLLIRIGISLATFCLSYGFIYPISHAQEKTPPKAEVPAPPKPHNLEEPIEPQVTIRKEGSNTLEEYRVGGKLYMIKVIPPVGAPYFLIDRNGRGSFSRAEGPGSTISVPQWVIHEF